ncbi:hypothetical protein L1049_002374 [Liquidambar formosana]|uniref:Uncharacterized protein n=1 Tax=Liquidambar formosana TaxID=63359 RepID=A0AAP0NFJ3_LIQFO
MIWMDRICSCFEISTTTNTSHLDTYSTIFVPRKQFSTDTKTATLLPCQLNSKRHRRARAFTRVRQRERERATDAAVLKHGQISEKVSHGCCKNGPGYATPLEAMSCPREGLIYVTCVYSDLVAYM